jgi:hypothetical protein
MYLAKPQRALSFKDQVMMLSGSISVMIWVSIENCQPLLNLVKIITRTQKLL